MVHGSWLVTHGAWLLVHGRSAGAEGDAPPPPTASPPTRSFLVHEPYAMAVNLNHRHTEWSTITKCADSPTTHMPKKPDVYLGTQ